MRMGVDTPIPVTSTSEVGQREVGAVTSFQYKNVGTNIDCVGGGPGGRPLTSSSIERRELVGLVRPSAHDGRA